MLSRCNLLFMKAYEYSFPFPRRRAWHVDPCIEFVNLLHQVVQCRFAVLLQVPDDKSPECLWLAHRPSLTSRSSTHTLCVAGASSSSL